MAIHEGAFKYVAGAQLSSFFTRWSADIKAIWNVVALTAVAGHVGEGTVNLREKLTEEADQEVLLKLEDFGIEAALLVAMPFDIEKELRRLFGDFA